MKVEISKYRLVVESLKFSDNKYLVFISLLIFQTIWATIKSSQTENQPLPWDQSKAYNIGLLEKANTDDF